MQLHLQLTGIYVYIKKYNHTYLSLLGFQAKSLEQTFSMFVRGLNYLQDLPLILILFLRIFSVLISKVLEFNFQ